MSKPVYIPPHRRGEGATVAGSECASQSLHSSTRQLFSDVLVINLKRRGDRLKRFTRSATRAFGTACWSRFDAIDGSTDEAARDGDFTTAWDATQNASYDRHVAQGPRRASAGERGCALSHVGIWRTVAASTTDDDWTLVCEDDCQFDDAFAVELEQRWSAVPHDAELVYLGFSDRGARAFVANSHESVFTPTYGFATHCYALRPSAARKFLSSLPIAGPLDVWLADHAWHGTKVYCIVVPGRGWRGTGAWLVTQDSKPGDADVQQSSRQSPWKDEGLALSVPESENAPLPLPPTKSRWTDTRVVGEEEAGLLAWLRSNGASIDKIEWPSYRTVGGVRGAVALVDIATEEAIFEIPHRLMMTPVHALESSEIGDMIRAEKDSLRGDMPLVLFIMHERGKGDNSFWHPYLLSLPTPCNICHWNETELEQLHDAQIAQRAKQRARRLQLVHQRVFVEKLAPAYPALFGGVAPRAAVQPMGAEGAPEKKHDEDRPSVAAVYQPEGWKGNGTWWSFEAFEFAWHTVQARAFGKRLPWSALVPFADLLNHANVQTKYSYVGDIEVAPGAEESLEVGGETRSFEDSAGSVRVCAGTEFGKSTEAQSIIAARKSTQAKHKWGPDFCFRLFASGDNPGYRQGSEVFNSYGRRPNDNLLLEYGFAMLDNEWDVVQLGIAIPLRDPLWHPKRKLLARNSVGTGRPLCVKNGELCHEMLVLHRILEMDETALRRALPHYFAAIESGSVSSSAAASSEYLSRGNVRAELSGSGVSNVSPSVERQGGATDRTIQIDGGGGRRDGSVVERYEEGSGDSHGGESIDESAWARTAQEPTTTTTTTTITTAAATKDSKIVSKPARYGRSPPPPAPMCSSTSDPPPLPPVDTMAKSTAGSTATSLASTMANMSMWSNLPRGAAPLSVENERAALRKMAKKLDKFADAAPTSLAEDEEQLAIFTSGQTFSVPLSSSLTPDRLHSALLYRITRKRIIVQQRLFVESLLTELTRIEEATSGIAPSVTAKAPPPPLWGHIESYRELLC